MSVDVVRLQLATQVTPPQNSLSLIAAVNNTQYSPPQDEAGYVALIDKRMLERECLAHSLEYHRIGRKVLTFSDLGEWITASRSIGVPSAVLFNAGNAASAPRQLVEEIAELVKAMAPAAVVILSDNQEINVVLEIMALGVRGYIPSSVSINVCIHAISLAIAGGRFIPASSLRGVRDLFGISAQQSMPAFAFTDRQLAVAEALRCGKGNRVIAVELQLSESTIKVHIRNVMKKLGATNRTEVACKIGSMGFTDKAPDVTPNFWREA